jgi:hypothetical protein
MVPVYSEFFYSVLCFFVFYCVIYHCFPSAIYIGSFPFFVPFFVSIQYFPSIFFNPFHQSLSLCIFHIVFGFSFPILPLLFPISCSSFFYSPVEVPSQEHTFFSLLLFYLWHLSLLSSFLCCILSFHYFLPFIAYMYVSFHTSFFFSLFSCFFSLIIRVSTLAVTKVAFYKHCVTF